MSFDTQIRTDEKYIEFIATLHQMTYEYMVLAHETKSIYELWELYSEYFIVDLDTFSQIFLGYLTEDLNAAFPRKLVNKIKHLALIHKSYESHIIALEALVSRILQEDSSAQRNETMTVIQINILTQAVTDGLTGTLALQSLLDQLTDELGEPNENKKVCMIVLQTLVRVLQNFTAIVESPSDLEFQIKTFLKNSNNFDICFEGTLNRLQQIRILYENVMSTNVYSLIGEATDTSYALSQLEEVTRDVDDGRNEVQKIYDDYAASGRFSLVEMSEAMLSAFSKNSESLNKVNDGDIYNLDETFQKSRLLKAEQFFRSNYVQSLDLLHEMGDFFPEFANNGRKLIIVNLLRRFQRFVHEPEWGIWYKPPYVSDLSEETVVNATDRDIDLVISNWLYLFAYQFNDHFVGTRGRIQATIEQRTSFDQKLNRVDHILRGFLEEYQVELNKARLVHHNHKRVCLA